MYIYTVLSDTDLTVQLKDEAGVNIGTADVYAIENYDFYGYNEGDQYLVIQPINQPRTSYPPEAIYPRHNMIFINTRVGTLETAPADNDEEPEV